MKKLILLAAMMVAPAAWADAPRVVVNDAGQTSSVTCGDGGELVLNGADNKITVSGGCSKVVVNGSGNTVIIEAADKITLNGAENTISYQRGWKSKAPKIVRTGTGNKISQAK